MRRILVLAFCVLVGIVASSTVMAEQGELPSLDHILWITRQAKSHGWWEVWRVGQGDMSLGGGSINFTVHPVDFTTGKARRRPMASVGNELSLGVSRWMGRSRAWFQRHGMKVVATSARTGEKLFEKDFRLYYREPVHARLVVQDDGSVAPLYEVVVETNAPNNPIPCEAVVFTRTSPGPTAFFGVGTVINSGSRGHIWLPAGTYDVKVRWLDQYTVDLPQTITIGEGLTPPAITFNHP